MPISQAIADFTGAMDAARAELTEVNAKISELEAKRERIARATPHTDDIVAVFMRGLESVTTDFEQQLGAHLVATFGGSEGAAAVAHGRSASVMRLESQAEREARLSRMHAKGAPLPELNVGAVTYFLRDQIAAEIPALVEKLFRPGLSGMKAADRRSALAEVDTELAQLRGQRDALHADLTAARQAVIR